MRDIRKRSGFSLVEILVALLIMTIAFAMIVTAPGYLLRLSEKAQIVTDIYDVALSWAERAIFEPMINNIDTTETLNNLTYVILIEKVTPDPSQGVIANTKVTVYPQDRQTEKVTLMIYTDQP